MMPPLKRAMLTQQNVVDSKKLYTSDWSKFGSHDSRYRRPGGCFDDKTELLAQNVQLLHTALILNQQLSQFLAPGKAGF